MDFLVLFSILGIAVALFVYMGLVFKLSDLAGDYMNDYVSYFVWMMGYVGLPVAITLSFLI